METIESGVVKMNGQEFMSDGQGRMVPIALVDPIDQARDQLVRDVINRSLETASLLRSFNSSVMDDIKAFVELSMEKYGVKRGGAKGNLTLSSYDGKYRIVVAVGDILAFDERLQAAKVIIDGLLEEWSVGAKPELLAIIHDAFQVDKTGKINTKSVLALRKIGIPDPRWQKAMDAISDSIQVAETKEYLRFYRRQNDDWEKISLDTPAA